MFILKALAEARSKSAVGVNKTASTNIPMGAGGKTPTGRGATSEASAKVTKRAEDDYYKPGNFSHLSGNLQSDLKVVSGAPVGSTVRINWGSSSTYARKTSSGTWVSDGGTKYSDRDVASNADFWTAVTLNTMVR